MSDIATSNEGFVVFYCFNSASGQPAPLTFLIPGIGKQVYPDGTKRMDVGGYSVRANKQGVLRVPADDEKAIDILRKTASMPNACVTEDYEKFLAATLPPDRKAARDAAKAKAETERAVAELNSLKAELKKVKSGKGE